MFGLKEDDREEKKRYSYALVRIIRSRVFLRMVGIRNNRREVKIQSI